MECSAMSSQRPMEDLNIPFLWNCLGTPVPTEKVLRNKKVVVFFFSASYCTSDVFQILAKLRGLHDVSLIASDATKGHRRNGLIIIYVSFDSDERVMLKDFKSNHHGWHCIPLGEPTIKMLELKYNISYIPQIIVVKMDGTIVTRHGVRDLIEHGNNVMIRWADPDITSFRYKPFDWLLITKLQQQEETTNNLLSEADKVANIDRDNLQHSSIMTSSDPDNVSSASMVSLI